MFKKGMTCVLSCALALSLCVPYAADIDADSTVIPVTGAEDGALNGNENIDGADSVKEAVKDTDIKSDEEIKDENTDAAEESDKDKNRTDENTDTEENTDKTVSAENTSVSSDKESEEAVIAEVGGLFIDNDNAAVVFSTDDVLGNTVDENEYTDEMTDNNGKYECVNLKPYGEINAVNQSKFDDKTIYGLAEVNKEAYVVYKAAGDRVFTALSAACYTRDGGKKATAYSSKDGETWTELSAFKYSGRGGYTPANDGYWSDKNTLTEDFAVADEIKYIKIYSAGESEQTKFKLGNVTLKTIDPDAEMPEPDTPEGYGAEINADTLTDEYESFEYMFDCVNLSEYTNIESWNDKSLLGFKTLGNEGYIIYKAGDNRVFTSFETKGYTRDGGKVGYVYVSTDGWEYEKIADPTSGWTGSSKSGSGANDAGWSEGFIAKKTFDEEDGIRYIKIYHPGEGAIQKFKFGYTTLATADQSKGCVVGDVYEEAFEDDYHIYKLNGAKLDGGKLSANGGSVEYKAIAKRALTDVELLTDGTAWNGKLEAFDRNGNKIRIDGEVTESAEADGVRVSAKLPSGCVYIKISGGTYSEIKISTAAAVGAEWSYLSETAAITAEADGESADSLKNGCKVSFSVPIKNTSSKTQKAKAYLCVFTGDRMDRIEEFDITVKSGKSETAEGSITLDSAGADTKVTLFVWTNLETMIPLGESSSFGDK